jgi:DNA-binding transcriptional regulator YiaG
VAEQLGVSKETIRLWETGDREPSRSDPSRDLHAWVWSDYPGAP